MRRDRLIILLAAAPGVLGLGLALLLTGDLIKAGVVCAVLSLISAGLSLTPPVQRARIRLLRRKYPQEAPGETTV